MCCDLPNYIFRIDCVTQTNYSMAWAELHLEELLENWERIEVEQQLLKIEGLG